MPLATLAAVAAIWQVAASRARSLQVPTFSGMLGGLWHVTIGGIVWGPLVLSNESLLIGYGLSVAIGVPLGLALARARWADSAVAPYLSILLTVPVAPLIPLSIIALGLGLASHVAIVVLFSIVYIVVNTRAGVRNVDGALVEMATAFGASEGQLWGKILIPGSLPVLFAGLRIALGRAILGMVVVELLLTATGLGKLLLDFNGRLQSEELFATVLVVVLESVLLTSLLQALERRLLPWSRQ
jgi:NitT/TauT family transport system permease protein